MVSIGGGDVSGGGGLSLWPAICLQQVESQARSSPGSLPVSIQSLYICSTVSKRSFVWETALSKLACPTLQCAQIDWSR